MGIITDWKRRRAVKKIAARLPAILAISYGASDYYTAAQINIAFRRLGINSRYIDIAHAAYLPLEIYAVITGETQASYEAARSLYQRYLPFGASSSPAPAPVNEYVRQMSGL